MTASVYAISDLHIWGAEDPIYRSLLTLIRERAVAGATLVLVGDLFDLFVGNKPIFVERYAEFFSALREAGARGAKIHYIEGNHDFLIRKAFRGMTGVELHDHDVTVFAGGKKFLFEHGDTVDRKDYSYRFLRGMFRSPLMRAFVAASPGKLLDRIGKSSSHYSREAKPALPDALPLRDMENMRTLYRSYAAERIAQGYDYVVMGHCHDLDEMSFVVDGRAGQYVNVGFPRVHGSFLSWSAGDDKIAREKLPT